MAPRRRTIELTDPRALRAVAHPVRLQLVGLLRREGPLTATQAGERLGESPASCSFHLRQLAKYGLVEEDPSAARDKRDRVWKLAAEQGISADLGALEDAPGGRAAVQVFRRSAAAWGHVVVDAAYAPPAERDKDTVRTVSEESVRLTKEEAQELSRALGDVVSAWVERTRGQRDDGRRTYLLFQVLQPHPDR